MPDSRQYINDSLLITPQLCEEHKGCGQGMAYMKRFYPNGFTVDDVYTKKARHIPMHFICWGYHFLPFTEEDKRKFIEYAKIKNCTAFALSHHIENCHRISDSSYCSDSQHIYFCRNVHNSYTVGHSNDIQESSFINNCTEAYSSTHCMLSERVVGSHYVLRSQDVTDGYGIIDCKNVENGLYLQNAKNIKNCIMSIGNNISNRIFCSENCEDFEYAIFDQAVSRVRFETVFNALKEILMEEPVLEDVEDFKQLKPVIVYWNRAFNKFYSRISELMFPISKEGKHFLFQHTLCQQILEEI